MLSDAERDLLTDAILKHVDGRVPVIVTTTHFSSHICAQRSRRAQHAGAAMVMAMPPYHGATIRVAEPAIIDFFRVVSDAIGIPIMIQDAPVSGTPLSAAFLARLATEIARVSYFKIETPGTAAKLRELLRLGGGGRRGSMGWRRGDHLDRRSRRGCDGQHDGRRLSRKCFGGSSTTTAPAGAPKPSPTYERWLPLINYENRQCGLLACKALLKEGGIIACDIPRHPLAPLHPAARTGLIEIARRLDARVLRWRDRRSASKKEVRRAVTGRSPRRAEPRQ